jgi:hypothetical protein
MLSMGGAAIVGQGANFPASIPNCVLWLTGSSFAYFNLSGNPSSIQLIGKDRSNYGHNMVQVSHGLPFDITLVAATPGTPAYISWNGLSATKLNGSFNNHIFGQQPELSIFVLRRSTVVNQRGWLFATYDAAGVIDSQNYINLIQYDSTVIGRYKFPTDLSYPNTDLGDCVDTYLASRNSRTLFRNGVQQASSSTDAGVLAAPINGYRLLENYASNGSSNQEFTGRLYEIIVYNRIVNTTERTNIENYLKAQVGL